MFTGIVETLGKVVSVTSSQDNVDFWIESPITHELHIDQSLSHDGVCLTVTEIAGQQHKVTAVAETLARTNLGTWNQGTVVNLERCLKADGRFDGHIVQGHVDCTSSLERLDDLQGSHKLYFHHPQEAGITVPKGSICVNGVSLTVVDSRDGKFTIVVIPFTWQNTNLGFLKVGDRVNIEFDIVGKYLQKMMQKK